ncbi:MAG: hypothetical protein R2705_16685 [Ilumatobacteraceae bacterium]
MYGLDPGQVRAARRRMSEVGSGPRPSRIPEDIMLGALADRRAARPIHREPHLESMLGLGHGRAQVQTSRSVGRDGRILAYRLNVLQDAGAYSLARPIRPT